MGQGFDLDRSNKRGETALLAAVQEGSPEVRWLVNVLCGKVDVSQGFYYQLMYCSRCEGTAGGCPERQC